MKTIISLLLISLMLGVSNAQNKDLEEIKTLTDNILQATYASDWDKVLEYTYPKIFELAPKEQVKEIIKQTFEGNDQFTIDLGKEIPVYTVSKLFNVDSVSYAFVTYPLELTMTFAKPLNEEQISMMKNGFEQAGMDSEFLSDEVIKVRKAHSIMVVLKDSYTDGAYKGYNYDPSNPFNGMIFNENIMKDAENLSKDLEEYDAKELVEQE